MAKIDEKVITSNKDFVGKVIEFCDNNKVLAELFNKECDKDIKLLSERSKNPGVGSSNELTKNLKSIDESTKKNYDLIQSISSLKEGEEVYETGKRKADFEGKILSLQENNDTGALNETVSFFENQNNKDKLIELARKHKSGITAFQLSFDKGMISSITERPEKFLKQKTNSTKSIQDKDKNYTGTHNADLGTIEHQSKIDFGRSACFLNGEEIQSDYKSIFNNLEKKIKEKFPKDVKK